MNIANFLRAGRTAKVTGALLMALLLISPFANGQDFSISSTELDANVTLEQLETAIRDVEARENLDAETRSKVIEQLRDAQAQVQYRLAAEIAIKAYQSTLITAPAETAALRDAADAEMSAAPTPETFGIDASTTLTELEGLLARELAGVTASEARLAELTAQISAQESRPAVARDRINQLRRSRDELAASIEVPAVAGEPQILGDVRKIAATLRLSAQGAEINKLEQESLSHSVRLNLRRAQQDVAERARLDAERRTELLRGIVNEKRQAAAMSAQVEAAAAEVAAADKHPIVRDLAVDNARLTRELPALAADIERVSSQLDQMSSEMRDIEQRLARSRQRLEVGGVSRALGRLLLEELGNLPQVSQYRAQLRARNSEFGEIGLLQVRMQEQQRELTPLDPTAKRLMAEVAVSVTGERELADIQRELRQLLRDRRELLLKVDSSYSQYLNLLGELDVAQRRLLASAAEYRVFLDQNLLWTPSAPIAFTGTWAEAAPSFARTVSPETWLDVTRTLVRSLAEHAVEAAIFMILLAALLLLQRPLGRRYKAMNLLVGRLSTDNIGLTLKALGIAAVRASPLPLMLAAISWFLSSATQTTTASSATSSALEVVSPFLYNVLLFRVLCAPQGVLLVHFGWQKDNLALIRRQLDRLFVVGAPLAYATVYLFNSQIVSDRGTIGRITFFALMILLMMMARPLVHPESGAAANYYRRWPETWPSKLRWVWYWLAVGLPLSLCLLSILGYLYTSLILAGQLVNTIWLALTLIVVNLVVLRWLALARRKLALQIALDERKSQIAEKDPKPTADGEALAVTSAPLDLDAVDQQTRKLMRSVLVVVAAIAGWGIWADLLPAFARFDQVALWTQTVVVDGAEIIAPVTLADLFVAMLILVVTAIASKNLPGLMEIAILQRLTLKPGSRYTINTLVSYAVVTIGVFAVLNIIGWNWSQIQWLVAALSVGLGFGLQEIVANFVSGLVILFERPVRVGDTVTVGQLTGTVSRIQIRATTITDWDRKEIIVPNKAFITEQVVNWTLSDPITRIVIPVGISYGSDVELAHRIMQDTLVSLPLVLDEPPPKVYFTGFGESSLDFKLYVFSPQLADRLPMIHAVHEAVLKALQQNGITIPFPQRDLHIRSAVETTKEGQ